MAKYAIHFETILQFDSMDEAEAAEAALRELSERVAQACAGGDCRSAVLVAVTVAAPVEPASPERQLDGSMN